VKPAPFDYIRPRDLKEATTALIENDWSMRILAGGQSLVPMLNLRLSTVRCLVDIAKLEELTGATETVDAVVYGACVKHAEFEDGLVPDATNGMMRYVARFLAYRAIRNRGTIGGSVSLADPAADWLTVLISLGAVFRLRNAQAERSVAAREMFIGPYSTVAGPTDVLTHIVVPKLSPKARWGFYKIIRKAGEYPLAAASVVIDPERGIYNAILGANDRAPSYLHETGRALASAQRGTKNDATVLNPAIYRDILAGAQSETYQAKLAATAVLRAATMALAA
jgi:aerobic carbon-monoxide dehydrogenase medium subunit